MYAATLRHLVASGTRAPGSCTWSTTPSPKFHETGIPEAEKRTPAPASDSTAPFTPAVRRCLEGARFDGRLFSLGGVPDGGDRLALAASSSGGPDNGTGGLFVLGHDGRTWRVTGEERHWVT